MAEQKGYQQFLEDFEKRSVLGDREEFVTKAAQKAGLNPARRAVAMFKAGRAYKRQEKKLAQKKKGYTTLGGKVLRAMGQKRTALWYDRFLGDPVKEEKEAKGSAVGTAHGSMGQDSGKLRSINKKLNILGMGLKDIQTDVTDIKQLLMPRGVTAKNAKGDVRFVQFNPLAPQGEQFQVVSQSGKLTPMKPGKDFQSSAQKKAAFEGAKLALKIQEQDKLRESGSLRRKDFVEPKEVTRVGKKKDPVEELKENQDKWFKNILGKMGSKGELVLAIIGIVGVLAYKIYKWFTDNRDGISMWIGDKVDEIKAWIEDKLNWVRDRFTALETATLKATMELSNKIRAPLEKLGLIKSQEEYDAENAAIREKQRTGELPMRGMGTIPENMQPDMDDDQREALMNAARNMRENAEKVEDEKQRAALLKNAADLEARATAPPKRKKKPKIKTGTGSLTTAASKTEDTGIPAEGYALLDAIAQPESEGRYDAIVGKGRFGADKYFTDFSKHPNQAGVGLHKETGAWVDVDSPDRGKKSTAAGRYQITKETWDELQAKHGLKDFSPESQDIAAWKLAKERYERGGGNLEQALKDGRLDEVASRLNKTWTSLAGGIEEQARGSVDSTRQRYEQALLTRNNQNALAPVSTVAANRVDGDSRSLQSNGGYSSSPVIVSAPQNNVKVSHSNVPRATIPKASALTEDPSFTRVAGMDVPHPLGV